MMKCPECGIDFNTHTCADGDVSLGFGPKAGDVTVCSQCAVICIFEEGEGIHKVTDEEVIKLKNVPGLWNELYRIIYLIKEGNIKEIREPSS